MSLDNRVTYLFLLNPKGEVDDLIYLAYPRLTGSFTVFFREKINGDDKKSSRSKVE